MRKLFYITSVIVLACVVASSVIVPVTSSGEENIPTATAPSTEQIIAEKTRYILTSTDDTLVVYITGSTKPYIETTTATSSLPRDIQQKISSGIYFDSEAEMLRALEEYCS